MVTCDYCTPEWFEHSFQLYKENPRFKKELEKVTTKVFYRVESDSDWGIDRDFLFGAIVNKGNLEKLAFFSEDDAKETADFIMSAPPHEWKKILRKENKFLTDFMLGKIALEQGSKVGVLGLAPYANTFIDALTQVDLKFQDEFTVKELEDYRKYVEKFRAELEI